MTTAADHGRQALLVVALAYTLILTLAPPALMAFLLPWSPAGMLLAHVQIFSSGSSPTHDRCHMKP